MPASIAGLRKAFDILRGGALGRVLDQALLEDERVRRVDDDQALDPVRMAERGQPGDRAAPIVADQSEALQFQRIGQRDQVLEDPVGLVLLDALGLVGGAEAALIGRDHEEIPGQSGQRPRARCGAIRESRGGTGSAPPLRAPPSWTLSVTPVGRSMRCGRQRSWIAHRLRHFGQRDELVMVVRAAGRSGRPSNPPSPG